MNNKRVHKTVNCQCDQCGEWIEHDEVRYFTADGSWCDKCWNKAYAASQAELAEDKKELYEMRGAMITSSTAMKVAGKKIAASQAEVELMRGLNVGNLEDRRYDRKR